MTDTVSQSKRSEIMAKVKSKNTRPEITVRHALHKAGFRFRLHRRDLPGSPDIVLPKRKTVIQVRGCFWHGHNCPRFRMPTSNQAYWMAKIDGNKKRDKKNDKLLKDLGWNVIVVWECGLRSKGHQKERLSNVISFLRENT